MPKHTVDDIGLPINSELRKLELSLSDLAAEWRGNRGNPHRQAEIKRKYHDTMSLMYALGWDGYLDFDSELPEEHMPPEYLRRCQ